MNWKSPLRKLIVGSLVAFAVISANATPVSLQTLWCPKANVLGTVTEQCNVVLSATAPSNIVVSLANNDGAISMPSSVTISKGHTTGSFMATIFGVTTTQTATILARLNGVTKTFQVTLETDAGTPALGISSTNVSFGAVTVGVTSAQTVQLTSTGSAPVTISSISVAGSLFSAAIDQTLPLTLAPGQSVPMSLLFTPSHASDYNFTGIVTVTSTAGSSAIDLAGSGAAPAPIQHRVTLNWNAPAPNGVVVFGYHVYRNNAMIAAPDTLAYVDTAVTPGTTYTYAVRSVDSAGDESINSNVITVTIPTP